MRGAGIASGPKDGTQAGLAVGQRHRPADADPGRAVEALSARALPVQARQSTDRRRAFVAYTYDAAGRQIAARDLQGKPIKGNTNKHGDTGKLYTNDTAWFVFNLPGAEKMAYTSDAFEPCVMGADAVMYEVNVKAR